MANFLNFKYLQIKVAEHGPFWANSCLPNCKNWTDLSDCVNICKCYSHAFRADVVLSPNEVIAVCNSYFIPWDLNLDNCIQPS